MGAQHGTIYKSEAEAKQRALSLAVTLCIKTTEAMNCIAC